MAVVKKWLKTALSLLEESLSPVPHELNNLDWKFDISQKGPQLAKHISAFSNLAVGGHLVFGIDDTGKVVGVKQTNIKTIISKIGSIARESVEPKVSIDHTVINFQEKPLLFIHIEESSDKPVHIRGKGIEESYIRSGAATHKMSKHEIGWCLINSKVPSFEGQEAAKFSSLNELLGTLDFRHFFDLLETPSPQNKNAISEKLDEYQMIKSENLIVNNLAVLLIAKHMPHFPSHERRGVRIISYKGTSRLEAIKDKVFNAGYALTFEQILGYVYQSLPTNEIIQDAFRKEVSIYPLVAIREILANAIIHQDFCIETMNPKIEIFSDRMEISNPGTLVAKTSIDRLIGSTNPRNELFARTMFKIRICEDRGSGLVRALTAIELYGLPPLKFEEAQNSFKVIIYAPQSYQEMNKSERVEACFQHCILKYLSNDKMTNATLRKRLGIDQRNYALASRIIKDALEANKIKVGNPDVKNPKYIHYVPFYA